MDGVPIENVEEGGKRKIAFYRPINEHLIFLTVVCFVPFLKCSLSEKQFYYLLIKNTKIGIYRDNIPESINVVIIIIALGAY